MGWAAILAVVLFGLSGLLHVRAVSFAMERTKLVASRNGSLLVAL